MHTAPEHLEHGRFKDAAADYKRLLKQQHRKEWVAGLAQAYAGRAQHLASRGMIKEAIALWHNRAETCGEPLADPRYLKWLLAAGRMQEIARLYREDAQALAGDEGIAGLRARLAAAALADGGDLIGQLPADDPVVRDFAAAEAALMAYASGDDEALDAASARIAFRSPYRDFRRLLKALLDHEQAGETDAQRWSRVPSDTPFAGIRSALEAASQAKPWQNIAALPAEVLPLVAALAGWNAEQVQQIIRLARLGTAPDDKALVDFVMTHQKALGQPFAREAAFALAGVDIPMQRRVARITKALPRAEKARLGAQVLEAHGAPVDAVDHWTVVLEALASEPDDDDNRVRQALIHRHIAELIQPPRSNLPLEPDVIDHLEASLELDAADRDSYLRLAAHYLHVRELKFARKWVDRALQQFPDDRECLFNAAQTAVIGGAYKKAAGFAQRILAVDPINSRARGLLVDAYLGHARKQIKAKKPEAARREIERAGQWARSAVDAGRVQMLHGLTTLMEKGREAAGADLKSGIEDAGGGLTGRFHLLVEAGRIGQDPATVTRAAGLPKVKESGDREQVLDLIRAVGALRDSQDYAPAVEAALGTLAPAIDQADKSELSYAQAELVCETLLRYRRYRSLTRYARAALKRWRQAPLFIFYWTQGRLEGRPATPWEPDARHLEPAYDRAQAAGDTRTAERIGAALDAAMSALTPFDETDPFAGDEQPAGTAEISPELRAVLEAILEPSDIRRLEDSLERGAPLPPDIQARIEAALADSREKPPPKRTRGKRKKQKNRKQPKTIPDPSPEPSQGDLFGDPE